MFPPEAGPYTWEVNGEPVRTRYGLPRQHVAAGRVKLPVCVVCNGLLAARFEEAAKPLVRHLFGTHAIAIFDPDEAKAMGLWFLKTWLFLAHPDATNPEPDVDPPRWRSVPAEVWTWTVSGHPPSEGLSLWVSRRGDSRQTDHSTRYIPLPVVVADGEETEFQVLRAGLGWPGSRSPYAGLDVSLVYHPGWGIEHPLEQEGRALRLWPRNQGGPADFAALPPVDPNEIIWVRGPRLHFFPRAFGSSRLPPLSPMFRPTDAQFVTFIERGSW
jgi:hypothetical protein